MFPVVIESAARSPDCDRVTEPVDATAKFARGSTPPIKIVRKTVSRKMERGLFLKVLGLTKTTSQSSLTQSAAKACLGVYHPRTENLRPDK
jgi:hypothetical protein